MTQPLSLYLDESETQKWPKSSGSPNLDKLWSGVGGILLGPRQIVPAAQFHGLLLKGISEAVGKPVTWVHTTDLMSRQKIYRKLSTTQVDTFGDEIVDFLASNRIRIVGARNNLGRLEKRRGMRDPPYLYTLESALVQTNLICKQWSASFRVTIARNSGVSQDEVLNFVARIQSESRIGSSEVPLVSRGLKHLDEITFGETRMSPYLQLADAVAWFVKRDEIRYRERLSKLWILDPWSRVPSVPEWSGMPTLSQPHSRGWGAEL